MHELIFYSMLLLVFIRIIGFIVSVDFYINTKSNTYIYHLIGWSLWAINGLFPLLSEIANNQTQKDFFILMYYVLGPLALLYLITGISSSYIKISPIKILYFSLILLIFPLIIYFTFELVFIALYTRIFQFLIIFLLLLLPILKFKNFKERIGRSIRWYYLTAFSILSFIPLMILNFVHTGTYQFFKSESNIIIIPVYSSIIILAILFIAFMIHLEYNISYAQKKDLKDKYSHNLGNILQAIESAHFITSSNKNDKENLLEAEDIIKTKFREASETLKEIRKL